MENRSEKQNSNRKKKTKEKREREREASRIGIVVEKQNPRKMVSLLS